MSGRDETSLRDCRQKPTRSPRSMSATVGLQDTRSCCRATGCSDRRCRRSRFCCRRWPIEDGLRLASAGSRILIADIFDPNIQSPYSMNVYLGVQQSLTSSMVIESAFVGNRGVKFRLYRTFNLPDRVTDQRPNPDQGQGNYLCSCQNTVYTSWQTSLRKRYSKKLTFDAHYTWAKALSYSGGDTGAGFSGDTFGAIQEFFDVRSNRGPSAGDVSHRFVADWVYDLPAFSNWSSAIARH